VRFFNEWRIWSPRLTIRGKVVQNIERFRPLTGVSVGVYIPQWENNVNYCSR